MVLILYYYKNILVSFEMVKNKNKYNFIDEDMFFMPYV